MCDMKVELDSLTLENLDEVETTLNDIKKGKMEIVGQQHLVKNMKFQGGSTPIGEQYLIDILYTCKLCKTRSNDIGICSLDSKYHEQICPNFRR